MLPGLSLPICPFLSVTVLCTSRAEHCVTVRFPCVFNLLFT